MNNKYVTCMYISCKYIYRITRRSKQLKWGHVT